MRTTILQTTKKNTQNGIKIDQAFQKKGLVNLETQQWKLQKAQKQGKKKDRKNGLSIMTSRKGSKKNT